MILDNIFFQFLDKAGKKIRDEKKMKNKIENIDDLYNVLDAIREGIDKKDKTCQVIGYILYNFVSSINVRKRKVTSRVAEDILGHFVGGEVRDESSRSNPLSTVEIEALDKYCFEEEWSISSDLSQNKREKADVKICNYNISLKTLIGETYDNKGSYKNKSDLNDELNIGSVSYRALLKNILDDSLLKELSDRKGGLGSKKQLKKVIFDNLKGNKKEEFIKRLELFFNYLYEDDFFILLKENYRMRMILFTGKNFTEAFRKAWDEGLDEFLSIFYRWENNNLRIKWPKLLEYLPDKKEVILKLESIFSDSTVDEFMQRKKKEILEALLEYVEY